MQVEIGQIYEGTVTGLTNFGAFVKLPTGESGMVHISEVAAVYVTDIKDHLAEGQTVKVKVIGVNENNKISLSIKQAAAPPAAEERPRRRNNLRSSRPQTWQGTPPAADPSTMSFEDMMAKFKHDSDERMSDLRRSSPEVRSNRRGNGGNRS